MADRPVAVEPADETPLVRRFRIYSVCVVALGLLVAVLVSMWLPPATHTNVLWTGVLLIAGFLVAEQLAINVDVRSGVSWSISFTEIPLAIGLFVAPFELVLLAHVVAGVSTLLIRGVHDRVLYNAGVFVIEISTAFAVLHAFNIGLDGIGPPWAGVFVGAFAAPISSTLLGLVTVHVLGRRMRVSAGIVLVGRTLVLGMVNAAVGVVGYEVSVHSVAGWPLVVLALSGFGALYVAYSGLLRDQRDLEALSQVSLIVARSGQQAAAKPATRLEDISADVASDEWHAIAERIKEQLGAARVVLHIRFDPQAPMRTAVAGTDLPEEAYNVDVNSAKGDPLLRLPGSHVRHFRRIDAMPEIRQSLIRRDATEALVVPLRSASHLLGVLEAHDRQSRWRGFGTADMRLIGTMASHLATALDNRRLLSRLRHDAYHDPLTGLLNRPGFRQAAAEQLRTDPKAMILRIDLDVLSTVSDALGYAWGDRMVAAAARRIKDTIGSDSMIARLEGIAFAALLPGRPLDEMHSLAERLRDMLIAPYLVERLTLDAGAVVGYASADTEDESTTVVDVDTLLQHADVAVRAARAGGEPVRAYMPSMGQIFLRRFQLVTQFRHAVETGQVKVHYQPKVALPSRNLIGVEALVRWTHPEYGNLDPDEFVPAIEAAGLVGALTGFVLQQALTKVRKWLDRGLRISAAVNISVRSLAEQDFPEQVSDLLARYGVPAELLTLELTESGVMADPQKALPVLRRLHTLGVILAVDDFGTGYSSLAYLRQLPVDEVKIDKSFVFGMGTDLSDLAVVRSIVELGHSLGLSVVAEGVEEDVARDQLSAMGCDVIQGYLISRPLSEGRLEAWLQARTTKTAGRLDETVLTLLS
jgi:diguanylate cyclase (GGDEF)-like protein